MGRQSGRKGMGSHKHYLSGHPGPSPKAKMSRMLEANKPKPQRAKAKLVSSVTEAFQPPRRMK